MTWTNFTIAPRRRLIATALMYGLSLTFRMTSAAGEEGRVTLQAAQCAVLPSTPINGAPGTPTLRIATLQSPARARTCHAGCEPALPT